VELEKRGTPAIVLATSDFERLSRYQAKAMGLPELRLVVVPAPLGGIPDEAALNKVPEALKTIASLFDVR
jgi:hypothetical protein